MAIQVRRGNAQDFVSGKMVAGEWAGVLDEKKVFFTFAPGDAKQLMTVEDAQVQLDNAVVSATNEAKGYKDEAAAQVVLAKAEVVNAQTEVANAKARADLSKASADDSESFAQASADSATDALASENNAKTSENASKNYSVDAEAWAVGQRNGTDVDSSDLTWENNSKFYSIVAKNLNDDSQKVIKEAKDILADAQKKIQSANFSVNMDTGELMYNSDSDYTFMIDTTTGDLMWEFKE